jgi:exopolysaccharide biosynthesis polyprenyl glycosylphosphotransferase
VSEQRTATDANVSRAFDRRAVGLQLSERKVLLAVMDLLCVNAALALAVGWRFGMAFRHGLLLRPQWFVVLTVVWLGVAFLLGSYDLRRAARLRAGAATGAVTGLVAAVVYLWIPYITPPLPSSRLALVTFLAAVVVPVTAWRALYALVLVQPTLRRRALVVGAGWSGQTIVQAVREHAPAEYDLVGFVDDDPNKQNTEVAGLPVLGTREDLYALVRQTGATEIIAAITQPDRMHPALFQAILDCHERGIQVTQMPVLFEQLTGRVPVEHAGRNLYVVLPLNGFPSRFHGAIKRVLDLVVGTAGLLLTGVLLPVVWVGLRLDSPGPVFHRQTRVGRGGKLFELIKFRTMVPDAEADGPQWAEEGDRRVTRLGRLLRRLHLDEAPQAINLLRGELSFIGPRPERPEFVVRLEKQIPFYRLRHAVRPGITGWAQVNYRYGASVEDALIKLQYDLYYIKHQSLWLDLLILVRTIGLVLTLRGR